MSSEMPTAATESTLAPALGTEHLFDYAVTLEQPLAIGPTPQGTRLFYEVREGRIAGPALNGQVLGGGGDWALVGADGWTLIDVRGQARTDDGAALYFRYRGVIEPTPALIAAMRTGGETGFEDQYWRASIEVETGDPRYRWLSQSALIGRGRLLPGPGVAYQVFKVC
jgi:hypothetical protein